MLEDEPQPPVPVLLLMRWGLSRQHCTVGSCPSAVQVSLACHYRVAAPKASVGFPEVRGAMGSH